MTLLLSLILSSFLISQVSTATQFDIDIKLVCYDQTLPNGTWCFEVNFDEWGRPEHRTADIVLISRNIEQDRKCLTGYHFNYKLQAGIENSDTDSDYRPILTLKHNCSYTPGESDVEIRKSMKPVPVTSKKVHLTWGMDILGVQSIF